MNFFIFDIETVPDVITGRRLWGLEGLSDAAVADAMMSQMKEATGQTFMKPHLHQVVAISAVFRRKEELRIWSLGEVDSGEAELIQRFFTGIEKYVPTLVSWNGSGFDLPVLHYRSLYHGIESEAYWEQGERNTSFKYNNYLSRYHARHLDLMDVLAAYQQKAFARLDEVATLLGLPGKMGMTGAQVWDYYLAGEKAAIRHYCEIDVLNTYLIFLRFQRIRGQLTQMEYQAELDLAKTTLRQLNKPHYDAFLAVWEETSAYVS